MNNDQYTINLTVNVNNNNTTNFIMNKHFNKNNINNHYKPNEKAYNSSTNNLQQNYSNNNNYTTNYQSNDNFNTENNYEKRAYLQFLQNYFLLQNKYYLKNFYQYQRKNQKDADSSGQFIDSITESKSIKMEKDLKHTERIYIKHGIDSILKKQNSDDMREKFLNASGNKSEESFLVESETVKDKNIYDGVGFEANNKPLENSTTYFSCNNFYDNELDNPDRNFTRIKKRTENATVLEINFDKIKTRSEIIRSLSVPIEIYSNEKRNFNIIGSKSIPCLKIFTSLNKSNDEEVNYLNMNKYFRNNTIMNCNIQTNCSNEKLKSYKNERNYSVLKSCPTEYTNKTWDIFVKKEKDNKFNLLSPLKSVTIGNKCSITDFNENSIEIKNKSSDSMGVYNENIFHNHTNKQERESKDDFKEIEKKSNSRKLNFGIEKILDKAQTSSPDSLIKLTMPNLILPHGLELCKSKTNGKTFLGVFNLSCDLPRGTRFGPFNINLDNKKLSYMNNCNGNNGYEWKSFNNVLYNNVKMKNKKIYKNIYKASLNKYMKLNKNIPINYMENLKKTNYTNIYNHLKTNLDQNNNNFSKNCIFNQNSYKHYLNENNTYEKHSPALLNSYVHCKNFNVTNNKNVDFKNYNPNYNKIRSDSNLHLINKSIPTNVIEPKFNHFNSNSLKELENSYENFFTKNLTENSSLIHNGEQLNNSKIFKSMDYTRHIISTNKIDNIASKLWSKNLSKTLNKETEIGNPNNFNKFENMFNSEDLRTNNTNNFNNLDIFNMNKYFSNERNGCNKIITMNKNSNEFSNINCNNTSSNIYQNFKFSNGMNNITNNEYALIDRNKTVQANVEFNEQNYYSNSLYDEVLNPGGISDQKNSVWMMYIRTSMSSLLSNMHSIKLGELWYFETSCHIKKGSELVLLFPYKECSTMNAQIFNFKIYEPENKFSNCFNSKDEEVQSKKSLKNDIKSERLLLPYGNSYNLMDELKQKSSQNLDKLSPLSVEQMSQSSLNQKSQSSLNQLWPDEISPHNWTQKRFFKKYIYDDINRDNYDSPSFNKPYFNKIPDQHEKLEKYSQLNKIDGGFPCNRCGKVFSYEYYRKKHLKYTRCVDHGDRRFPCQFCSRSFEKKDRLRIHVLHVHEKHRPHVCNTCGKTFSQSSSLNKHNRVHSGERPYKCPYCPKAFTASSILRTHIRQHSGEKPFKCKYCGKAFASHAAHDSHVRRTHNVTLMNKNVFNNTSNNPINAFDCY